MPPRRRPKAHRAPRCSYQENGRRCVRSAVGEGTPPLCSTCRIAVQELARRSERTPVQRVHDVIADFMAGRRINEQDALGVVQDVFAQWAGVGAGYRPPVGPSVPFPGGFPFQWPGGAQRHPPPPPPPDDSDALRAREALRARQVLGFAASEPLTEEAINNRRRQLARKHHPDRGGSLTKMQDINTAADLLLDSPRQW